MSTVYTILTGALLLAFSHPVMRLFIIQTAPPFITVYWR